MGRRRNSPVNVLSPWVRRQFMKVKSFLALVTVLSSLIALKYLVADPNNFYIAGEAIHAAGIVVLIYNLNTKKTCCDFLCGFACVRRLGFMRWRYGR